MKKKLVTFFIFLVSISAGASESARYEYKDVVYTIKPNAQKVAAYRKKLQLLFIEFGQVVPPKPMWGANNAKGAFTSVDQIRIATEHTSTYRFSSEFEEINFISLFTTRGEFDRALLLSRGDEENLFLGYSEWIPQMTTKVFHGRRKETVSISWLASLSKLRESLVEGTQHYKSNSGRTVSFFAVGYSDLMLQAVREILEQGIIINELTIKDVAIEYSPPAESPKMNIFYNPKKFKNAELLSGFNLAASSSGGLSQSCNIFLTGTDVGK